MSRVLEVAGITPGEWFADLRGGCVAVYPKGRESDTPGCHFDDSRNIHYSSKYSKFSGAHWEMDEQAVNDALLFAEAGTIANETGLTPRQLAEQRAELLAVLQKIMQQIKKSDYLFKDSSEFYAAHDAIKKATAK